MYTNSLPPATVYSSWAESIEVYDVETDEPFDLSVCSEIKLTLRDPIARFDELVLTMTNGDIVLPATGVLQWNVSAGTMGSIFPKTYEAILLLIDDEGTTVPLILGSLTLVE